MTTTDQQEIEAAYDELRRIATRIVALRNPDVDQPYVQAVALISEYTSIRLDQDNSAGFSLATPPEQSLAASRGLVLMAMEYQSMSNHVEDE